VKQKLGHLITFSSCGREKTKYLTCQAKNEKSRVISTAKVTQLQKQKFYRYKNQNNDDNYDKK
jgi:hypothetical protein